jgi:hypothetical protein
MLGTRLGKQVSNSTRHAARPEEKTMAMSMGGGGASAPQMNVTPLIDVLLVLIIIFIVIVAESKEEHQGLEAQIPQPPAHPDSAPPPIRTIVIQLAETKSGVEVHCRVAVLS